MWSEHCLKTAWSTRCQKSGHHCALWLLKDFQYCLKLKVIKYRSRGPLLLEHGHFLSDEKREAEGEELAKGWIRTGKHFQYCAKTRVLSCFHWLSQKHCCWAACQSATVNTTAVCTNTCQHFWLITRWSRTQVRHWAESLRQVKNIKQSGCRSGTHLVRRLF